MTTQARTTIAQAEADYNEASKRFAQNPDSIELKMAMYKAYDALHAMVHAHPKTLDPRDFKYMTGCIGTDRYPYEIIRVVSDKTVEIRAMGFRMIAGSAMEEHQEYEFTPDKNQEVFRVRRNKTGYFFSKGIGYALTTQPKAYFDPYR